MIPILHDLASLSRDLAITANRALDTSSIEHLQSDEDALTQLLEIEQRLLQVTSRIRRMRNCASCVPISSLPTEILGAIFEHLRDRKSSPYGTYQSYRPLLNAMFVCHRWYDIASERPTLWTDISLRDVKSWPGSLRRSKAAPVRCLLLVGNENALQTTTLIEGLAFRLRELNLQVDHTVESEWKFPGVYMPCLKRLVHTMYAPHSEAYTPAPDQFPALQKLALSFTYWKPLGTMHSLTCLIVTGSGRNSDYNDFLNMLNFTPMLKHLFVGYCALIPTESALVHRPQLLHLAELHLFQSMDLCAMLVRQLVLPSNVQIHCSQSVSYYGPSDLQLQNIFSATPTLLTDPASGSLSMHIGTHYTDHSCHPYMSVKTKRGDLRLYGDGADTGQETHEYQVPWYTSVSNAIPSAWQVTELYLGIEVPGWKIGSLALFPRLPALRRVVFCGWAEYDVPAHREIGPAVADLLNSADCPQLCEIVIAARRFDRRSRHPSSWDWNDIVQAASHRAMRGNRLQSFVFCHYADEQALATAFGDQFVRDLTKHVGKVTCRPDASGWTGDDPSLILRSAESLVEELWS